MRCRTRSPFLFGGLLSGLPVALRPCPLALLPLLLLALPASAADAPPLDLTWPDATLTDEGALSLPLAPDQREAAAFSAWFPVDPYRRYLLRFEVRDVPLVDAHAYLEYRDSRGPETEWLWPTDYRPRPPVWSAEETRFLTPGGVTQARLRLVARASGSSRLDLPVLWRDLMLLPEEPLTLLPQPRPLPVLNPGFERFTPEGRPWGWSAWVGDLADATARLGDAAQGDCYLHLPEGKSLLLRASAAVTPLDGIFRFSAQIRGAGSLRFGARTQFPYSVPLWQPRVGDDRWTAVSARPDAWTPVSAEIPLHVPGLDNFIPFLYLIGPLDVDDFRLERLTE